MPTAASSVQEGGESDARSQPRFQLAAESDNRRLIKQLLLEGGIRKVPPGLVQLVGRECRRRATQPGGIKGPLKRQSAMLVPSLAVAVGRGIPATQDAINGAGWERLSSQGAPGVPPHLSWSWQQVLFIFQVCQGCLPPSPGQRERGAGLGLHQGSSWGLAGASSCPFCPSCTKSLPFVGMPLAELCRAKV